ncbi:PhzF family phenazine biosynthesis protein [Kutzneria kofuensis]|uniref:PhzF family phenazine biosynthesis protein n=1 Tax=Kutzneria kofuensis TaxID=103725 RepID=A0A7W9KNR9_9PSEU|nr:PhzF family phenazine biosynthesis protein [Kutzneria kofuensis]MBB5895963.1 PhzF family phenazine biosynthesis protein [Kutzneria kofuensis]
MQETLRLPHTGKAVPALSPTIHLVHVFPDGPSGGNPAPIVVDADTMSDAEMQEIAKTYGHESAFILPAAAPFDFALRFWVPNHEMPMCGHATVGAVHTLHRLNRLTRTRLTISTPSGPVQARIADAAVEITQPPATVTPAPPTDVLEVLGITEQDLAAHPVQNASTSRVKTLIPLASQAILDALTPDFSRIPELCDQLGSTGLYPYAPSDPATQTFDARQFPRSSGYPEDAATGIAAAALAYGLLDNHLINPDRPVHVRQGRAMGKPSRITLRLTPTGLWLGGQVH